MTCLLEKPLTKLFLQELIQEVERVNRPSGELKQYHLRFLRVDAPFGQSVIFCRYHQ